MFPAKGMEGAGDTTPLTKRRPRDYMGKEWSNAATSQGPPESQMENSSNQDCLGAQGPPKRGLGGKNAVLGLKRAKKLQGVSNRGTVGLQQP